jgi:hypothetical protein
MATILVNLGAYVGTTMMDPVYNYCRVDKPLSPEDKEKLTNRAKNDGQHAIEAIRLERDGYHAEAIEKWKYIFVSGFPR